MAPKLSPRLLKRRLFVVVALLVALLSVYPLVAKEPQKSRQGWTRSLALR
jgi:hypothetical protein